MELLGYFTTKGRALSAKLLTGTALQINRAEAGGGATDLSASALAQSCQVLAMGTPRRNGTTVTLPVTLTAAQAAEDYSLTEVGLYAQDPEEGEILYRLYRLDQPVGIVAGDRLTIRFDLQEIVSETAEVQVSVTSAGVLLQEDLDALRGVPDGIATLDESALVPVSQLPYTWGTEELEPGVSPLRTGALHFVYE